MDNIFIIQALLRLLDFAAIRKFNLKDKNVNFDDKIGKKALSINEKLKETKGLDIFSKKITNDEISKFEHLIGNAMSNHINKKVVLRKIDDEIKILKNAIPLDKAIYEKFNIKFSDSLNRMLEKVSTINSEILLKLVIKANYISKLPHEVLKHHYFTQSIVNINKKDFFLISVLSHEHNKRENLHVNELFLLNKEQYSKFDRNPIQLFLKGLDKYGIDLSINGTLSRFYYHIEVPLNTNIQSVEFLNMQNIDRSEPFSLSMLLKKTEKSIELQDVFATRTNLIINEFNNNIA
ncbi:MAG: hypothetical protein GXO79_06275 [Chlorobi bacterium]|nr:hypothetical protein [Chlorobiota bacterium]